MNMKIIISPAKKIDSSKNRNNTPFSEHLFLDKAKELVSILKDFSPTELSELMGISANLGLLNTDRYLNWSLPFSQKNAKQVILTFKGDVYQGINADDFEREDFDFAQKHLRILSGLYGLLKPLDLMQAYRLEMGTKLKTDKGNNLYQFWGDSLTQCLANEIKIDKESCLINLASNEYGKVLNMKELGVPVITPVFKDFKNGQLKIISFFAKKARGRMCRYIIKNKITSANKLQNFNDGGYTFEKEISSESEFVFVR
jgi:cytoplasmic iron level regulating protein YaaA (DUF328/UPF0246 family)